MKFVTLIILILSFQAQAQTISSVNAGEKIEANKLNELIDRINDLKIICQEKFLSSDKGGDSIINRFLPELYFYNLTPNKPYIIYIKMRYSVADTTSADNGLDINTNSV